MLEISNDYVLKLKELIKCDTVSKLQIVNEKKSYEFKEVLKNLFPNVFRKCRIKEIDNSVVIEMIGKRSSAPVLFLSHFDTADIKGEWEHGPLDGDVEDGKIYGRGSLDAKGNLFCILEAFEELIQEEYMPSQDFYLALVCDKESEDQSINNIYTYFKNSGIYFSYVMDEGGCIIDSPINGLNKNYAVVGLGEKGSAVLKFISSIKGRNSITPVSDSALIRLGLFAEEFDYGDVFKKSIHKSLHPLFYKLSQDMNGFKKFIFSKSKIFSPIIKLMLKKDPLVLSLIQSSLSFVSIHGSDSTNTIPSEAYAIANLRIGLNDSLDNCLKRINDIARHYDIKVEVLKEEDATRVTSTNSYQFMALEEVIKDEFDNIDVIPFVSISTCDARIMDRLCGNCYRFIPFKVTNDQILRIHGLDENIDINNLERAVSFYKKLIKK